MTASPVVSIKNLRIALPKGAERPFAVDGVSLDLNPGKIVCVVGESGSGKSMCAHALMGLLPDTVSVTSGEIQFEGHDLLKLDDSGWRDLRGRRLAMIFQEPMTALNPLMRIGDQMAEMFEAHGLLTPKERRAKALALAREVGLPDPERIVRAYPHQLSGGQRQRVAIARALAPKPSVLLLDEPFGAVDAKIRQELREWLTTLHHEVNVTTIFVTHDQEEALEVADRIVVFSRGRLEQVGTPREVYEQPANETVARFIGVMNVLELEVRNGKARIGELEFPSHGLFEGQKLRIGFRPYAVQISSDLTQYRYHAILRRTYFLGVLLRVELQLPSGLIIRTRMTKEDYANHSLEDGHEVSFQIRQYRVLARETGSLPQETELLYQAPPSFGENI